jgi:hypothetical protein
MAANRFCCWDTFLTKQRPLFPREVNNKEVLLEESKYTSHSHKEYPNHKQGDGNAAITAIQSVYPHGKKYFVQFRLSERHS